MMFYFKKFRLFNDSLTEYRKLLHQGQETGLLCFDAIMQYLENVMNGSVMKTYGLIKSSELINFYPLLKSSEDIWFSDDFRGNRSSAIQNKFRPVVQR